MMPHAGLGGRPPQCPAFILKPDQGIVMPETAIHMYWPLFVVVISNVLYNITSKSIPERISPWAVLVVTYLVASFLSFIAYFIFEDNRDFIHSVQKMNWTGFALGFSMVGLEIGYIFIYRIGWKISVASLLANLLLAVILLFIGLLFYREQLNLKQLIGIAFCMAGCILLMMQK